MNVEFNQNQTVSPKKPKSRIKICKWIGVAALVLCLSFLSGWMFFCRVFYIPTSGMQPTLMGQRTTPDGEVVRGDHIFVERLSYRFHGPKRGDVAVFATDAIPAAERERLGIPPNEIYVKRIVGLPGERVSIEPHAILINGQKLVEPKIFEMLMAKTNENSNIAAGFKFPKTDIQLGPGEYYVMGDNITNSLDSRYYGAIKADHFVGRVLWIFWPEDRRGIVE